MERAHFDAHITPSPLLWICFYASEKWSFQSALMVCTEDSVYPAVCVRMVRSVTWRLVTATALRAGWAKCVTNVSMSAKEFLC